MHYLPASREDITLFTFLSNRSTMAAKEFNVVIAVDASDSSKNAFLCEYYFVYIMLDDNIVNIALKLVKACKLAHVWKEKHGVFDNID